MFIFLLISGKLWIGHIFRTCGNRCFLMMYNSRKTNASTHIFFVSFSLLECKSITSWLNQLSIECRTTLIERKSTAKSCKTSSWYTRWSTESRYIRTNNTETKSRFRQAFAKMLYLPSFFSFSSKQAITTNWTQKTLIVCNEGFFVCVNRDAYYLSFLSLNCFNYMYSSSY